MYIVMPDTDAEVDICIEVYICLEVDICIHSNVQPDTDAVQFDNDMKN